MRFMIVFSALVLAACSPSYDGVLPMPDQGEVESDGAQLDAAGRIHRIATFHSRTLILKRKDYPVNLAQDPLSEFAPMDLVMAWGRAGLQENRNGVSLAQGQRRYAWKANLKAWQRPGVKEFGQNTANWHLIPADEIIAKELSSLKPGDVVDLDGDLVSVKLTGGMTARSSTSREDDGDGACEIIRVTHVQVS